MMCEQTVLHEVHELADWTCRACHTRQVACSSTSVRARWHNLYMIRNQDTYMGAKPRPKQSEICSFIFRRCTGNTGPPHVVLARECVTAHTCESIPASLAPVISRSEASVRLIEACSNVHRAIHPLSCASAALLSASLTRNSTPCHLRVQRRSTYSSTMRSAICIAAVLAVLVLG